MYITMYIIHVSASLTNNSLKIHVDGKFMFIYNFNG